MREPRSQALCLCQFGNARASARTGNLFDDRDSE